MQVMDNREFEQDHVLIGQQGEIGKATVTNDPILMSMLSTGLYANPLKSMVQEIVFNAWDAHRMGKCLDKPIDIYFNDTTGFIVRDYGPGIQPGKKFIEVYFTYGGSTKRDDDEATGGFGLGSKAPFAYTDTFNVTNHYEGAKYMYIMHRVHDANDGGPGFTPIIEGVPTEEKGLMVSAPFRTSNDKERAYTYLKEILYLSGIKANIHYEGIQSDRNDQPIPPVELVKSDSLAPNEFISHPDNGHGFLYAVYGGVSYEIPKRDEYAEEFNFLQKLALAVGDLYIGFAPNKLTPLPTREGLNMGERSTESITAALETIHEHFMTMGPMVLRACMHEVLKETKTYGIQAHYVHTKWKQVLNFRAHLNQMVQTEFKFQRLYDRRPENVHETSWNSLARVIMTDVRFVGDLLGRKVMTNAGTVIWCKVYPEHLAWRKAFTDIDMDIGGQKVNEWSQDTIKLWTELCDVTDQLVEPRIKIGDYQSKFEPYTNIRAAGSFSASMRNRQLEIVKRLDKENKLKTPSKPSPDTLWSKKDRNPHKYVMMDKTVILAKTITALNRTEFATRIQRAMVPTYPTNNHLYQNPMQYQTWMGIGRTYTPVVAFVVHKKKGQYDLAKKWLEDKGYTVIEADEPEVRAKPVYEDKDLDPVTGQNVVVEVPEKPKGFPKVAVWETHWEDIEYVQKPSTYLYLTKTNIRSYGDYPNKELVKMIQKFAPNMVMVHNKKQADRLDKAGALSMWQRLDKLVEDILADKERIKLMYFHWYLHNYSCFPEELLEMPQMHKLMGVPYIRTKHKVKFYRDLKLLQFVSRNDRYRDGQDVPMDLRIKAQKALDAAKHEDSLVLVRKMNGASRMFDKREMTKVLEGQTRGQKKVFIEKLARFLRTV